MKKIAIRGIVVLVVITVMLFLIDVREAQKFQEEFGFWPRNVRFYSDGPRELLTKEKQIVSEVLGRNEQILKNTLGEIVKANRKEYSVLQKNYSEMSKKFERTEELAKRFGYLK